MAHAQILASVKDRPLEELPFINWEEAALQLGGDEPDEAFLAELLVTFYHEAIPHLQRLLAVCLAYRQDQHVQFRWQEGKKPDPAPRTVERVLKEEAHALKGSAANLRLYRIAKAAEQVELPAKRIMLELEEPSSSTAATMSAEDIERDRAQVLDSMCGSKGPCSEIKRLTAEFRDLAVFMGGDGFRNKFAPGFDLESELPPEQLEQLRAISVEDFDDSVIRRFQDFWMEGETLPGNIGTGKGKAVVGSRGQPSQPSQPSSQPAAAVTAAATTQPGQHQLPNLGSQDSSAPLTGSAAAAAAAASATSTTTSAVGTTTPVSTATTNPAPAPSSSSTSSSAAAAQPPPAAAALPQAIQPPQQQQQQQLAAPPAPAPAPVPAAFASGGGGGGKGCCVVQ